jgi:hypothetical protein
VNDYMDLWITDGRLCRYFGNSRRCEGAVEGDWKLGGYHLRKGKGVFYVEDAKSK